MKEKNFSNSLELGDLEVVVDSVAPNAVTRLEVVNEELQVRAGVRATNRLFDSQCYHHACDNEIDR